MQKGSVDLKAIVWLRNSTVLIVLGPYHGSIDLQLTLCATVLSPRRLHIASAAFFILQVPYFICRYLLLNIQAPFSTRQQAIRGTVLFTPDLLTPHTAFLHATVPVFWNVSTHFSYPCAHQSNASCSRCRHNRWKLITYRASRPPSWENGTWQVPSQLSHSDAWCNKRISLI